MGCKLHTLVCKLYTYVLRIALCFGTFSAEVTGTKCRCFPVCPCVSHSTGPKQTHETVKTTAACRSTLPVCSLISPMFVVPLSQNRIRLEYKVYRVFAFFTKRIASQPRFCRLHCKNVRQTHIRQNREDKYMATTADSVKLFSQHCNTAHCGNASLSGPWNPKTPGPS